MSCAESMPERGPRQMQIQHELAKCSTTVRSPADWIVQYVLRKALVIEHPASMLFCGTGCLRLAGAFEWLDVPDFQRGFGMRCVIEVPCQLQVGAFHIETRFGEHRFEPVLGFISLHEQDVPPVVIDFHSPSWLAGSTGRQRPRFTLAA